MEDFYDILDDNLNGKTVEKLLIDSDKELLSHLEEYKSFLYILAALFSLRNSVNFINQQIYNRLIRPAYHFRSFPVDLYTKSTCTTDNLVCML